MSLLLRILSWFYGVLWAIRRWGYASGWLPSHRLDARVICVGNLTTGGTGKTPMVVMLAKEFLGEGHKVGILTRGYRGKNKNRVTIVSDGMHRKSTVRESGDEAVLMADALPGIPVLASPDRYRAGLEAIRTFSSDLLLLDDGFQHFRLQRDLNLLLVDGTNPFGGGELLPLGRLREPLSGIRRADAVVITRVDQVRDLTEIEKTIHRHHPRVPVFEAVHEAWAVTDPISGAAFPLQSLRGRPVVLLSGIGNPASFRNTLALLGADILDECLYPDHHSYTKEDLNRVQSICNRSPDPILVTTEKDWVRLQTFAPVLKTKALRVVKVRLRMLDEEGWAAWIAERVPT